MRSKLLSLGLVIILISSIASVWLTSGCGPYSQPAGTAFQVETGERFGIADPVVLAARMLKLAGFSAEKE